MIFLAEDSPFRDYAPYVILLGLVMVTTSLLIGIRRKRRAAGSRVTAREQLERYKEKAAVRDDLQSVMVEVEQLAKRLSAQLDARAIAVERLIDEAEAKIQRLEQLTRERQPPAPPADPVKPPAEADPPDAGPTDELTRSVYALADEGAAAPEIARQLGEHVGKVELILALRAT